MTYHVAVDIGASSGRLILGYFAENRLVLEEIHRFPNKFTREDGFDVWDTEKLLKEIFIGLQKIKGRGITVCTLAVDTWGVDYVCVDKNGAMLGKAVAYRDRRTDGIMERLTAGLGKDIIYSKTAVQFLPFNTLYQLAAEPRKKLELTKHILLIPDYLTFRLTGEYLTEYTNATTTQLFNPKTDDFDGDLLELAGVGRRQFAPLVRPGTKVGPLRACWYKTHNIPQCYVIACASHDTASAVAGASGGVDSWAFLSSGTWSLLGRENTRVVITKQAMQAGYSNEGGACGTYRFLKNIMGLWLFQEVQRLLPGSASFAELTAQSGAAKPHCAYIPVNDSRFMNPPDMVKAIQNYCYESGQPVPQRPEELVRIVFDSLAVSYGEALDELEVLSGQRVDSLVIVGGGSKNLLLNQLTADMTGRVVITGSSEATALGNIGIQMLAEGYFSSLNEMREASASSFTGTTFFPAAGFDRAAVLNKYKETII
jgi:rhamnulokinase